MTQIERIIQGLLIAQEFDPDAKIISERHIIIIKANTAIEREKRLEWLGWLYLPATDKTMIFFYTDTNRNK